MFLDGTSLENVDVADVRFQVVQLAAHQAPFVNFAIVPVLVIGETKKQPFATGAGQPAVDQKNTITNFWGPTVLQRLIGDEVQPKKITKTPTAQRVVNIPTVRTVVQSVSRLTALSR